MARPERNNVDYFPLYCDEGEKMFYLEQTYGNDGFAVFIKLLRELAKKDYHYLNLSSQSSKMFMAAKCRVSIETLESIIKDLSDLHKFDTKLWRDYSIIWCQDFVDSIQDAYSKRNNKCITYDSLLLLLDSLGVLKLSKFNSKGDINPQSIVEKRKEDKSRVFIPPSKDELITYFTASGYTKESALKAFNYYDVSDWKDGKGNKIKNWKQKMIGVWFKDENKLNKNADNQEKHIASTKYKTL